MSDIITDTSVSRPWHGSDSPFEALHDWMIKELDAIKAAASPTIKALEARIVELETTIRTPAPTTPTHVEPMTPVAVPEPVPLPVEMPAPVSTTADVTA